MPSKIVNKSVIDYLKAKYPNKEPFYSNYVEGGYLDRSYVEFLDKNYNHLEYDKNHMGNYA